MCARMIPAEPPPDTASRAELTLFPLLRDGLDDTFTVFHSFAFTGHNQEGVPLDLEIDFLIFSPALGLLVIEAKDGLIEYDGTTGVWFQNRRPLEKSPFRQARFAMYQLRDFLGARVAGLRSMPMGYAVCLPDAFRPPAVWPVDASPDICLTGADMEIAAESVSRILRARAGEDSRTVSPDLAVRLEAALTAGCRLGGSLADLFGCDDRRIADLTEEQCRLLDFIGNRRQALIEGCAGSGKTVMASRKARELASEGRSVLLLVFNLMLADRLSLTLADTPGVTVSAFHPFCETLIVSRGTPLPELKDRYYYENFLPEELLRALEAAPRQYDAVIVDEGQDFKPHYWAVISQLVAPGGWFYIFYDREQDVFGGGNEYPIEGEPFQLKVNCRNTRRIYDLLLDYTDHPMGSLKTPEGTSVEEHYSREPSQRRNWLSKVLHRLIVTEGLKPSQVMVLGGHDPDKTCLPPDGHVGAFVVGREVSGLSNGVEYQTYLKFKGCEADAVILLDVDPDDPRWSRQGLYTSISRARHLLVIIGIKNPRNRDSEVAGG